MKFFFNLIVIACGMVNTAQAQNCYNEFITTAGPYPLFAYMNCTHTESLTLLVTDVSVKKITWSFENPSVINDTMTLTTNTNKINSIDFARYRLLKKISINDSVTYVVDRLLLRPMSYYFATFESVTETDSSICVQLYSDPSDQEELFGMHPKLRSISPEAEPFTTPRKAILGGDTILAGVRGFLTKQFCFDKAKVLPSGRTQERTVRLFMEWACGFVEKDIVISPRATTVGIEEVPVSQLIDNNGVVTEMFTVMNLLGQTIQVFYPGDVFHKKVKNQVVLLRDSHGNITKML